LTLRHDELIFLVSTSREQSGMSIRSRKNDNIERRTDSSSLQSKCSAALVFQCLNYFARYVAVYPRLLPIAGSSFRQVVSSFIAKWLESTKNNTSSIWRHPNNHSVVQSEEWHILAGSHFQPLHVSHACSLYPCSESVSYKSESYHTKASPLSERHGTGRPWVTQFNG
jgi:hypothetical protein